MKIPRSIPAFALGLCLAAIHASPSVAAEPRQTISLDGQWAVAEGTMGQVPARFGHAVPVPGLVDMATPPFAEVGTPRSRDLRQAFWYRRTIVLRGTVPTVATLKVHKAAYGTRVFLNGSLVGDHLPSFTPGYFDVRPHLHGQGATNELIVRVGAFRDAVPDTIPAGWDFEKTKYIPGIFDSVELILSGTPNIVRVQAAPDLTNRLVRVQTLVRNVGTEVRARLNLLVREARSGRVVARARSESISLGQTEERTVTVEVPLRRCRLWSPDDPFLYELEVSSGADTLHTRFGMREFHFDPRTGRAILNGRPWFLRGSNVTLYRFFEDSQRGDRPWREEWVRRLHRRFKEMHWHALRYCIGFPPELWYRVADEEGFLIQDEFPLWHLSGGRHDETWPQGLKADELAREYTEWMQERWNHPCVVIWDAQNETVSPETGPAIQQVRGLDLSHRPWDNGWSPAQAPGDCFESHPYLFQNPDFKLADLARVSGVPRGNALPNAGTNAILLNEYGWLWLNRDGTPTTLTRKIYANLLGADATAAQRRHLYARSLAALTEFWRGHRACAGVLHFCGLGYSRPDGQTSDHFLDLEQLVFEPEFYHYVRDAFAPVGVMIDAWADRFNGGERRTIPVIVLNDLYQPWHGSLRLRLVRDGVVLHQETRRCTVPALGEVRAEFDSAVPVEAGRYQLEATLLNAGSGPVSSLRDFEVRPR
ncbi:MAG: hypothetical protein KGS61_04615 [Verrucomicrobia bacterium]|nr:hypothetical protein [Verrucomicrobiota bacterium]